MTQPFRAAVLRAPGQPLEIEKVTARALAPGDVRIRVRASGICHTDLEAAEGNLVVPTPIVLGHEAAGEVAEVGGEVSDLRVGDHVVLSWNPHCGHCFYCDRDLPILCEGYLHGSRAAFHFDGRSRLAANTGADVHQLMYVGSFAEYVTVPAQQAIKVPADIPFDVAALIGCGVMTGVGAALNVADIGPSSTVMVIGCGAVGLAAIQGARLAGCHAIIAVDRDGTKLALVRRMGASASVDASRDDPVAVAREATSGRGVDCVLEAAGSAAAFRLSTEVVRPGGEIVWLGKMSAQAEVSFRWGGLMQEKRIRRSSYGNARPARDFPLLAQAYLDGRLLLDHLVTGRIGLEQINDGLDLLARGNAIRSVIVFDA